jgi:hypothetical protein
MNARQAAKLAMYRLVKSTVEAHPQVLTSFAPFANAYGIFASYLQQIDEALELQETSSRGATQTKEDRRERVINDLLKIIAALKYYGTTQDNRDAQDVGRISRSTLEDVSAPSFTGKAYMILSVAEANAAALVPLGITAALLADAATKLGAYVDYLASPDRSVTQKRRGTSLIVEYLNAMDAILKGQMDPAAELMRGDHVEFVTEYFFSREIHDPSYHTRALEVRVTDSVTGHPLPGVRGRILPVGIDKHTGEAGRFYVPHLEAGDYEVVLEVAGYQLKTVPFYVVQGQRTELVESMMKKEA